AIPFILFRRTYRDRVERIRLYGLHAAPILLIRINDDVQIFFLLGFQLSRNVVRNERHQAMAIAVDTDDLVGVGTVVEYFGLIAWRMLERFFGFKYLFVHVGNRSV